jgi:hypothetical protein
MPNLTEGRQFIPFNGDIDGINEEADNTKPKKKKSKCIIS